VAVTLTQWRREMVVARLTALTNPGPAYLDAGPTGAGKTFADSAVLKYLSRKGERSVSLVLTHKDCEALVSQHRSAGVESVAAFAHLDEKTCQRIDEADEVHALGLSAESALCPDCPYAAGCPFQEQYREAQAARHAVATHARGKVMPALLRGRAYISLHENPLDLLRPSLIVARGLKVVGLIAGEAADTTRSPTDRGFYRRLEAVARELDGWHHGSNVTCEVPLPRPAAPEPRHPRVAPER
jgi:hypothetical protein